MPTSSWSARAYSFFDTLLWIACLNMLWLAFTILGLGVLGAGPATAAAQILVRRRATGEAARLLPGFAREYFRNFVRGNALALPVMGVAVALAMNWNYFAGAGGLLAQLAAAATFVGAIFVTGAVCYLFPMFARYELPLPQYFLMASRFALRHLAGTVILLFVSAAVVYASGAVPGLIPFFSVGAWLFLTGWLCDSFFTANDDAMAAIAEQQQQAGRVDHPAPASPARPKQGALEPA